MIANTGAEDGFIAKVILSPEAARHTAGGLFQVALCNRLTGGRDDEQIGF